MTHDLIHIHACWQPIAHDKITRNDDVQDIASLPRMNEVTNWIDMGG
jgi:hypothetical protein